MAALAAASVPPSPWIPEDDLLLKNSVEAGASLEALAKGAVRFSRKFTIQELRDRWHSLLYDRDISAEAAARMAEIELSASNLLSKFSRFGNSKESAEVYAKRKVESIRRQYYAMRKRICRQPCNSTNLGFFGAPDVYDCSDNEINCQKHIALDNGLPEGSFMLGDHIPNHFGLQEMGVDISDHVYPHIREDVAASNAVGGTADVFYTETPNSLEDIHPKGVMREDCYNEFPEGVLSSSVKESKQNDCEHSFEQNYAHKDMPHILGDTVVDFGNGRGVEEMGSSCAIPDSNSSFHAIGSSSPLPRMPIWKTMEDISAPAMPVDVSLGDQGQGAEDPDDVNGKKISSSEYNVHSEAMLEDRHAGDEIKTVISDSDFADLSDSLLNFANEDDFLFMNVDEKDTTNESSDDGLNSLLLSSPKDVHEDDVPNIFESHTLVSNTHLAIPHDACPGGSDVIPDPSHSGHGDQHTICYSEVNMPSSTSVPSPHFPDFHEGVMECTLNSEDPEIPCNDILSPIAHSSFIIHRSNKEVSDLASSSDKQKKNEQEHSLIKKEENPAEPFTASQMVGPDTSPETSPNHPLVSCRVKSEFPDSNCLAVVSQQANNAHADPSQCRSVYATASSATDGVLQEEETRAPRTFDEHEPLLAKPDSIKMTSLEPEANPSTLDQEESESDDEVPCFSDIEAMILEMDLCPSDQDSYISREVLRYQHEDTKRTIMRLEQCARSSMQRTIASQGALAILYGRRLKHYIKTTEVILGRATGDNDVDIDLGREGRPNKISRRQALIKMEGDGSFYLKNLGKSSILLNGKEVASGQLLSLNSSSLIEIRGMAFAFEMNHRSVRQYLANVTRKSQEKNTKFDWSPEGVP